MGLGFREFGVWPFRALEVQGLGHGFWDRVRVEGFGSAPLRKACISGRGLMSLGLARSVVLQLLHPASQSP